MKVTELKSTLGVLYMLEIWPLEIYNEAEKTRHEAILQAALYPLDQALQKLYVSWLRKYRWTAEEAASLVMKRTPS